jgi:DNA-binding transcriptional regulator/RsmH inhibitor MraZ
MARDVVIVGMTRRFEIWSRERWEQVFQQAQVKLTSMGARLADLGL